MKGKIVKRLKKELIRLGCDKFEREDTSGRCKPKSYSLKTYYHCNVLITVGRNDIQAYKLALKTILLEQNKGIITRNNLWYMKENKGVIFMDYCAICKSRHTWDCEDERETGRTKCDNFELDFSALDSDTKSLLEKIIIKIKEEYEE